MKKTALAILFALAAAGAMAQSNLQLNLKKGSTYTQQTNSQMKIMQQIQGMSMDMEITINQTFKFSVIDVKDTVFLTEMRISKVSTQIKSPFANMVLSSESTDKNDEGSKMLSLIVNKPIKATLSRTGRVLKVNVDSLLNAIATSQDGKGLQAGVNQQLYAMYSEKPLTQSLENSMGFYPSTNVKVGSKWKTNHTIENMVTFQADNSYEVVEESPESFTISCKSEMSTPNGNASSAFGGGVSKCNISGTTNGTIKVDKSTGWVISSTLKQAMKGAVTVSQPQQPAQDMTIPIVITGTTTVTQ